MFTAVLATLRQRVGALRRLAISERAALLYLALAGGLNTLVLLVQGRAVLVTEFSNADNASALALAKLVGRAPAHTVVDLGDQTWYEAWLFMRATAGFPGYRQLWEIAPFIVVYLGYALVVWCAWRVLGHLAAAMTAVMLLSGGYWIRSFLFAPSGRGGAVLHAAVLCAVLMIVWERLARGTLTIRFALLIGAIAAVFTAGGTTDSFEVVCVIIPFVLAPLSLWYLTGTRAGALTATFALVTAGLALLGGALLSHMMTADHLVTEPFGITFVAGSGLVASLQSAITTFTLFADGNFYGSALHQSTWLMFASAGLCLAGLTAVLVASWRALGRMWSGAELRTESPDGVRDGARALFVSFWALGLVINFAAFAFTSLSTGSPPRYLIVAWISMAALLGLLVASPRHRGLAVAGVLAFSLIIAHELITTGEPTSTPNPTTPPYATAAAIERYVTARHATLGFAGYWEAAPLSFETRFKLTVAPVDACGSTLCPFRGARLSNWYVPQAHERSFLLVTSAQPLDEVAAPAPKLGRPLSVATFGAFAVYVYSYDIASMFG